MTVIEVAIGPGGAPGMFTAAPGARSCHAHADGDRQLARSRCFRISPRSHRSGRHMGCGHPATIG